ncbi:MAG: tetratricopeptide repeat protein, partial [Aphanizomenon flos-aquae Clear-A1]|nr:tetratricopeptide repeat protein [Aphanizomenon flos-aquae Clear-A1]
MTGTILRQRYKIIKQLGAGGFGETYLAEDLDIPVTPKPVCVVKKLHPTMITPDSLRLFEQEAKILYELGKYHDQIPKLSSYFQQDKDFYLIQEFIDGYDLTQEISAGKKLSEGDVIKLLRDVLEILVYVHENKVIHRDVKPANIMRRKDGKLVLIDFGVVKQINTTIAMKSGFTSKTVGVYTEGYTPAEQKAGKPKLSSDIYALGMTAIQALIGLPPHSLPDDKNGEILWHYGSEVSDKLAHFITKMVRYDWRQRYRDAKEALEELNKVFGVSQQQNIYSGTQYQVKDWLEDGNKLLFNYAKKFWNEFNDQLNQFSAKDLFVEGNKLLRLQKYQEAIASYDKAIAIKPDFHEAWYGRGLCLDNLQKYQEAIASFDKAIAIKSDYYYAWHNRGFSLNELQKYQEAITSFDKAIAIKPDFYDAWNNRGFSLEKLQKYQEAITSFAEVLNVKKSLIKIAQNML